MGPAQTARHVRRTYLNSSSLAITAHMLSWANHRYTTPKQLDRAKDRVINFTTHFPLTAAWGDGSRCAADGTLRDIYEDNLLAESHIRYHGKGGIAYHHIADTYVALFSTFIPCGVWEAVEIIEALLKNQSFIKPDTIHADTQGQSTVVFGLAYLLGIKLMPRIRNWKDLKFFRPSKEETYKNIDSLFSDIIDYTYVIYQLQKEGITFTREDLSRISPYMTGHIRRFGDIIIDLEQRLENIDIIRNIQLF